MSVARLRLVSLTREAPLGCASYTIIETSSVGCGCSYINLTKAESLDWSLNTSTHRSGPPNPRQALSQCRASTCFVLGCVLFRTSAMLFALSLHHHIHTFAAASHSHFPTFQFPLHRAISSSRQLGPDLHLRSSHIPTVHFPGAPSLLALLAFFCCWLCCELCSCSQAYFWSFDCLALFL